jgi:hypothetical protein
MKKLACVFLTITMSFILLGCSNIGQSELKPSITVTPTIVFESSSTPTVLTRTPRPTITLYPTSTTTLTPTLVQIPKSTFEADKAITQTPLPPAQCPPDTKGISLPDLDTLNQSQGFFEETILEILNQGGIREIVTKLSEERAYADVTREDLTHDNSPELIISNRFNRPGYLSVFGCENGQYKKLLTVNAVYDYTPRALKIQDLNLNGMPDMVLVETVCSYCLGVRILEWDGQEFQSLIREWYIDPSRNEISSSDMGGLDGIAEAKVLDTDQNGTYEVVVQGGIPNALGDVYLNGPYHSRTIIYMWDGLYYSISSRRYSPPEYRFQAIQDGDDAAIQGNYEEALAFYQDVIFSDQLKGWSADERENLRAQANVMYTGSPTPTPLPPHNEDYIPLAAYARYRIMLLHVLNGYQNDAQVVYDTLQEKFSDGTAGYPYAEMATAFWDEFLSSNDIELSCRQAIEYADTHPEMLLPLNGPEFSFWSKTYYPFDVCPFKNK